MCDYYLCEPETQNQGHNCTPQSLPGFVTVQECNNHVNSNPNHYFDPACGGPTECCPLPSVLYRCPSGEDCQGCLAEDSNCTPEDNDAGTFASKTTCESQGNSCECVEKWDCVAPNNIPRLSGCTEGEYSVTAIPMGVHDDEATCAANCCDKFNCVNENCEPTTDCAALFPNLPACNLDCGGSPPGPVVKVTIFQEIDGTLLRIFDWVSFTSLWWAGTPMLTCTNKNTNGLTDWGELFVKGYDIKGVEVPIHIIPDSIPPTVGAWNFADVGGDPLLQKITFTGVGVESLVTGGSNHFLFSFKVNGGIDEWIIHYDAPPGGTNPDPPMPHENPNCAAVDTYSCNGNICVLDPNSNLTKEQCGLLCGVPGEGGLPGVNADNIKITSSVKRQYTDYLNSIRFPYNDSTISDPTISNRGYRLQGKFVPIHNGKNVRLDIFSKVIHASLNYVFSFPKKHQSFANEAAFDDITINNIYLSLNNATKKIIDNVYDSLGQPLRTQILSRLKYLILTDQVENFDLVGIKDIKNKKQDRLNKTLGNEEAALTEISIKGKNLSYKHYGGRHRERMKMWKTLAPDLNKAITLVLEDSTVEYVDINIDDSYSLVLSGGGTETLYINDGDFITYINSNGGNSYSEIYTEIDNAKMLDISETTRIHKLYGDDHFFKFSVSSDETELVEETYSLDTPHPEVFILKLDPSTVEDLPREKSVIRKSKAVYSVITDETEINNWISTKPWPYLIKYLDHQDPFLNHLQSSNSLTCEFKDISFDIFHGYEEQFPILPRRIPWYIMVIPTDRTRHLLGNGRSLLTGFASRELTFGYSPFISETSQKWNPPLFNMTEGDRGDGILPFDNYDFPMSLTYSPSKFSLYTFPYKKNTEPLPRKASPIRTFLTTLSDIKASGEDYVDEGNTIMPWGSIYKYIPVMDKKALAMVESKNWVELKGKLETNTLATDPTVKDRYIKLSESPFLGIPSAESFITPSKKLRPAKIIIDTETPEEL